MVFIKSIHSLGHPHNNTLMFLRYRCELVSYYFLSGINIIINFLYITYLTKQEDMVDCSFLRLILFYAENVLIPISVKRVNL